MKKWVVVGVILAVSFLYAHPITVDGDPSDWVGTPPGVDSFAISNQEGIWHDAAGDDLGDGGDAGFSPDNPEPYSYPTNPAFLGTEADILEWRVTADPSAQKLYFLIKMNNFDETWIPMVAVTLDIIHDVDHGNEYYPNYADLKLPPINKWEYSFVVYDNQVTVYDTLWNDVTGNSEVVFDTANNVIEVGIDVSGWTLDVFNSVVYFTCGAGLQDYGNFREVDSLASEWTGGGGIGPGTEDWVEPDIYDLCFVDSASQAGNLNIYLYNPPIVLPSQLQAGTVQDIDITELYSETPGIKINEFIVTPTSAEAIELFNSDAWSYDLTNYIILITGYSFEDTLFINSGVTIPGNGYLVIDDSNIIGDLTLPNSGAIITLLTPDYTVIDRVAYGSMGGAPAPIYQWSAARSPNGYDTDNDAADFNMDPTPTMGYENDAPSSALGETDVVINEVKATSDSVSGAFVELYNRGADTVDISDWMIVVNDEYYIPSGTLLGPGEFFVLTEDNFPPYFNIGEDGDNLYIFNSVGERVDQMGWWSVNSGTQSFAVIPDGERTVFDGYDINTSTDFTLADPTPGESNGQLPYEIVFYDDFESGLSNWTGDWGLQSGDTVYQGQYSYTDSPNALSPNLSTLIGEMANGVDLTPYLNAFIDFYYVHWLEEGFDYAYLDVSPDGGNTWITLREYNGFVDEWTHEHIDISGFVNSSNFKVRFRLVTDPAVTYTGMFVDSFVITGYLIDISPPLIIHEPPADTQSIEGDFTVIARFLDASGISSDTLYYSFDGGPFVPVSHDSVSGDTFYFTIPAQEAGTFVDYYFRVVDGSDSLFETVSDTFHYIAGRILHYDCADPQHYTYGLTGQGFAVLFPVPPDSQAFVATLLYNFYTDPDNPIDSAEVHVWGVENGLPGADLITPFNIWPANTPEEPEAWTYVDVRNFGLIVTDTFFVGYTFVTDSIPSILTCMPAVHLHSYIYDGTTWMPDADSDIRIRAIVGVEPHGIKESSSGRPAYFKLFRPNPNPMSGRVSIKYALPTKSHVRIDIYNIAGRLVKTLVDKEEEAGVRTVVWNGIDRTGKRVPMGVYFIHFNANGYKEVEKVILIK